MSVTTAPPVEAPYAATIHALELDLLGHPFRPGAARLGASPVDTAQLRELGADRRRACVHVGPEEQRRVDRGSKSHASWIAGR